MNEFNFKILSNLPLDDADIKLLKDWRKGKIQGMIYFAVLINAIMLIMFFSIDNFSESSIFTIIGSNLTLLTVFVLIIKTECNINKIIIAKKTNYMVYLFK